MTEVHYHGVGGALWIVQVWLFAYFPELSNVDSFPSMSLGLSAAQSIRTMSINSISYFFPKLSKPFFASTVPKAGH